MKLIAKWVGRDPQDPTGTGVFESGTERAEVEFRRFGDFHAVYQIMVGAYEDGRRSMADDLEHAVARVMREAR
jgi:hypothetical protein